MHRHTNVGFQQAVEPVMPLHLHARACKGTHTRACTRANIVRTRTIDINARTPSNPSRTFSRTNARGGGNAPVHKHRKFSAVFGTMLANSSNSMRPTACNSASREVEQERRDYMQTCEVGQRAYIPAYRDVEEHDWIILVLTHRISLSFAGFVGFQDCAFRANGRGAGA